MEQGVLVSMPSKKRRDGIFHDIAHPLNSDTRRRFETPIIDEYREVVGKPAERPTRLPPGPVAGS